MKKVKVRVRYPDEPARRVTGVLLHFPESGRHFVMLRHYCNNPDCDCNSVHLTLAESDASGKPRTADLPLKLELDLTTWRPDKKSGFSLEEKRLVEEFLAVLDEEMKHDLKSEYDRRKNRARAERHLATYVIPPETMNTNTMVAFADLCHEPNPSSPGQPISFYFQHEDTEYLVQDFYCPKPGCKCKEVKLVFLKMCTSPEETLEEIFHVCHHLDGTSEIEVFDDVDFPLAEAQRLHDVFEQAHPDLRKILKGRDREVKKIGKRSLTAARDAASDAAARTRMRDGVGKNTGRNDPCPCGSGKKFKHCCGS